jgi:hypothetical protein
VTSAAAMRRLVRGAFLEDGTVADDVAALLLQLRSRAELKAFLAAVKRDQRRRSVSVQIAGQEAPVRLAVEARYPGRPVDVAAEPALGAGMLVRAGDDIVDGSVRGIIRKIIAELGANAPGAQKNASGTPT